MTVQELLTRFPEIPADLHREPLLARLAEACGELLARARKPSNCSPEHDAANHYYLKLIGPLSLYGYGLSSKEKVRSQLQELLDRQRADPEGFPASLVPAGSAEREVRGPGCDG
jgi:hypothetical protein